REVRRFEGDVRYIRSLAFSQDGRFALTGIGHITVKDGKAVPVDCSVRLWEVATGREVRRFDGHSSSVQCVAFSPDGRRAVSVSPDGTIMLWDLPADFGAAVKAPAEKRAPVPAGSQLAEAEKRIK